MSGYLTDSINGNGLVNRFVYIVFKSAMWGSDDGGTDGVHTQSLGVYYTYWRPGYWADSLYYVKAEFSGDVWYNSAQTEWVFAQLK